jgi:hypothetical protein
MKGTEMADDKTPPATASENLPATASENLPAVQGVDLEADAGSGMEGISSKDLATPFLMVLQQLSPQLNKQKPEYIQGAEQGEFYNNVTKERSKTKILIPCYYMRRFTEWRPRAKGGGMVADYGSNEECLAKTKKNERGKDVTPDGNEISQAGTYFCLDYNEEHKSFEKVVVSLQSTQLKKARRWNTLASSIQLTSAKTGKIFTPALYYMSYMATTVPESNDSGSWYGWKIEQYKPVPQLPNGDQLYMAAKEFREAVVKGIVKVAPPPESPDDKDIPF